MSDKWYLYIKSSPEFDQYLFDHREEILAKKSAAFDMSMAHGKAILEDQSHKPKCPTCSSTNITRISVTSKVVNTAMFGLFGQKRKHQFHCKNCGYKW